MFSKAVNGTYYVVEAVPDTSKHMTYITSAYMTKNKPTGVQSADAFVPTLTAKPEADLPVGTQNVSQGTANVNSVPCGSENETIGLQYILDKRKKRNER